MVKPGDILIPIHRSWKKYFHERVTVLDVNQETGEFEARWSDNPRRIFHYEFDDIKMWFKIDESINVNKILEHYE